MPSTFMRMIARTFSIEEARQLADKFEASGYETEIVENKKGSIRMYEVWAGKKGEGFEAKGKSIGKPRMPFARETRTD